MLIHIGVPVVYFHFNIVMVTLATILTSTVMRVHSKVSSASILLRLTAFFAKRRRFVICNKLRNTPALSISTWMVTFDYMLRVQEP